MKLITLTALSLSLASHAHLTVFDSQKVEDNETVRAQWLAETLLREPLHSVTFRTGFPLSTNMHKAVLPGNLQLTSSDETAEIQVASTEFGGSIPVDSRAISLDESAVVTLSFEEAPVNYFALYEMDNVQVSYLISFADGSTEFYEGDTTAASGVSGEFLGFLAGPNEGISSVEITASVGDGRWGIDALEYGRLRTIYVDSTATGAGNGRTWANAFPVLQDALAETSESFPSNVFIAEGTYRPDDGLGQIDNDRSSSFIPATQSTLFGGFPEGGAEPSERDEVENPCILSGLLNPGAAAGDQLHSYHVASFPGLSQSGYIRLVGLIIQDGKADGDFPDVLGGGFWAKNTFPDRVDIFLQDCVFQNNRATHGGGVSLQTDKIREIENCHFLNNIASSSGGGLSIRTSGNDSLFKHVSFRGNTASRGAGVQFQDSDSILTDCLFSGNSASLEGGALASTRASLDFTNCTFHANRAASEGSVISHFNGGA